MDEIEKAQRALCSRFGAAWVAAPGHLKIGVARNVTSALVPLHGLRHPPEGDTCGWYLWAGEGGIPSADPEFFVPLHVEHLRSWRPEALKFLGLPPGWRFLTDGAHIDVWEDPSLLLTTR